MSLSDAIIYGSEQDVDQVLQAGANVNEIDIYGYTPLIETIIMSKEGLTRRLLAEGADVDVRDLTGRSALHWAADNHELSICQLLLEHKADPNAYTLSSEPVLAYPLLRREDDTKQLLYRYGADLSFGQDFINTKLLAHRFELQGQVEIVNHRKKLIDLDMEGFFLEFTLELIEQSLTRYKNHYAAREMQAYFRFIQVIIEALNNASRLMRYQHYMIDIQEYADIINPSLQHAPLILPVGYRGHAITYIYYGDFLAKCDRRKSDYMDSSVIVYKINRKHAFTLDFLKQLIYKRQSPEFIEHGMDDYLGLQPIAHLPLPYQIAGNCSWANVEAVIPAMVFLMLLASQPAHRDEEITLYKEHAFHLHHAWLTWDQDTALSECISSFHSAIPARKAAKASLLAAVLFQSCDYKKDKDIQRAEKILKILTLPDFDYVLKSYLRIYYKKYRTQGGKDLAALLDVCGVSLDLYT